MDKNEKMLSLLLLEAEDSSAALANLNRWRKSVSDTWSMQLLCKRAAIPSTGYYSDVLKGKRTLHPKYLKGIKKAFDLSPTQARYLELLFTAGYHLS